MLGYDNCCDLLVNVFGTVSHTLVNFGFEVKAYDYLLSTPGCSQGTFETARYWFISTLLHHNRFFLI